MANKKIVRKMQDELRKQINELIEKIEENKILAQYMHNKALVDMTYNERWEKQKQMVGMLEKQLEEHKQFMTYLIELDI